MALTKSQAVRIAAYNSEYLTNHRFTQEGAWGNIYIKHYYALPDQVWTFFALGKDGEEVTSDVLDRLSAAHDLTLVLPLKSVSPKIFNTISKIEKSWWGKNKQIKRSVPADELWHYFRITLVTEDALSIEERRYYCREFDDEDKIAGHISYMIKGKGGKTAQEPAAGSQAKAQKDFAWFLSLSKKEMQDAVQSFLLKYPSSVVSLVNINKIAQKSKRKRCFEDVDAEQKLRVIGKAQKLFKTGLDKMPVEIKIMDELLLERTIGLEEMLKEIAVKAGPASILPQGRLPVYEIHIKDATDDQWMAICQSILQLLEFGFTSGEVKSKIAARHGFSESEIPDGLIEELATLKVSQLFRFVPLSILREWRAKWGAIGEAS